jgi:hypothetical protein
MILTPLNCGGWASALDPRIRKLPSPEATCHVLRDYALDLVQVSIGLVEHELDPGHPRPSASGRIPQALGAQEEAALGDDNFPSPQAAQHRVGLSDQPPEPDLPLDELAQRAEGLPGPGVSSSFAGT